MAWVQAFPTPNTLISQSVAQIQANWLFLQTNINTDHYFNTGAANEGGHRHVSLQNLGADPALVLDAVLYNKAVTLRSQPFWENAQGVFRFPFGAQGSVAIGAGAQPRVINLIPFLSYGLYMFQAQVVGAEAETFSCCVSVDAANVHAYGLLQLSNAFTAVSNAGLTLQVTTTKNNAFTLNYAYWGMQV